MTKKVEKAKGPFWEAIKKIDRALADLLSSASHLDHSIGRVAVPPSPDPGPGSGRAGPGGEGMTGSVLQFGDPKPPLKGVTYEPELRSLAAPIAAMGGNDTPLVEYGNLVQALKDLTEAAKDHGGDLPGHHPLTLAIKRAEWVLSGVR